MSSARRLCPLRQHIGAAAGVLDPAAVALAGDNRRHHAVEEIAVVGDQQHRAGVIGQLLLQQVERLQIEIVGRLVENQQVGRAGEGAGPG
jgi:hypothetical protein